MWSPGIAYNKITFVWELFSNARDSWFSSDQASDKLHHGQIHAFCILQQSDKIRCLHYA